MLICSHNFLITQGLDGGEGGISLFRVKRVKPQ